MGTPLLVVTSDENFGNLIRRNLEEAGRFSVCVVNGLRKAEQHAMDRGLDIVFLDTDEVDDTQVLLIGTTLMRANRALRFIIASGGGWHSGLEELRPLGYLSKPYYLPDLTDMMNKIYPPSRAQTQPAKLAAFTAAVATTSELPWLADNNRAAQYLTRLSLESSAQAALITRKDSLWAYAGQLPESAAIELANTVARYRDKRGESDLLRFVRLESTNADHMLYATRLTGGMVLALVFDAETHFSTIRKEAGKLVRLLSSEPPVEVAGIEEEDDSDPLPTISFSDILNEVPSPNPEKRVERQVVSETTPDTDPQSHPQREISRESSPVVLLKQMMYTEEEQQVDETPLAESLTAETQARKDRKKTGPKPMGESHANPTSEPRGGFVLEPISHSVCNLTYACVLIPRFPEHLLTGDMADKLREWVPQLCVAFGWRLEHRTVHPNYLEWLCSIPPQTSPGYVMRIMRQHLSVRVFDEFPRFTKENPSGDFWAPGYIIVGGMETPPAALIEKNIEQIRQKQGFIKPRES